jgi:hypothetical protein
LPVEGRGIPHLAKNERDVGPTRRLLLVQEACHFIFQLAAASQPLDDKKERAAVYKEWLLNRDIFQTYFGQI